MEVEDNRFSSFTSETGPTQNCYIIMERCPKWIESLAEDTVITSNPLRVDTEILPDSPSDGSAKSDDSVGIKLCLFSVIKSERT